MEKKYLSKSGLPLYTYTNSSLHSFSLCIYVKAGALYEKKEENGITHFFEHVAIRNINTILDGKLYEMLDRMGLGINGTTYKEFVQFSMNGAVTHFREAVDIMMHIFEPLILSDEDLDTERKRVIAEIREYSSEKQMARRLEKRVWKGTSLAGTIIGKKKTLKKIGKEELSKFRENFFSPENSFLYLTGCVSDDDIEYLLEHIPEKEIHHASVLRQNKAEIPENFFRRSGRAKYIPSKRTVAAIAFDVDCTPYKDAELSFFYNMMFLGDCCPFFQELSEKTGYIYSYDDQFERYRNIGIVRVIFEVSEEKLEQALTAALSIFRKMKEDTYTMEYVRAIFIDNSEMVLDDDGDFNWNRAYECHILDENYPDIESKKQEMLKITRRDIQAISKQVFRKENMTVMIKGKRSKKKNKALQKIIDETL